MTPEDLIREGLHMKVPALQPDENRDQCSLCIGPFDSHCVDSLLRQSDEETGPMMRHHLVKALLVRFLCVCQTCASRIEAAGIVVTIPLGAR